MRITEHYAKCKSVPTHVREWAVEKLGRSAEKRKGKEAVKKMEGVFDDINSNKCATELCDESISHFIYDNLCSFNLTAVERYSRQDIVVQ